MDLNSAIRLMRVGDTLHVTKEDENVCTVQVSRGSMRATQMLRLPVGVKLRKLIESFSVLDVPEKP